MTPSLSGLESIFISNIQTGTTGSSDERAFHSFQEALINTTNKAEFRRDDAFLSVIIVSDEDDFSHTDYLTGIKGYYLTENYNDPNIHTIKSYVDFLDSYTLSLPGGVKNYSVNSISAMDQACVDQLQLDGFTGRKIAQRYMALADATGGIKSSLCGNFGDSLALISDKILELSNVFKLDREPIPETIHVFVNNVEILQDPINGWTYDPVAMTISFHGVSIPPASAIIQIPFQPKAIVN